MNKPLLPRPCRGCPLTVLVLTHETTWTDFTPFLLGEKKGIKRVKVTAIVIGKIFG
jgi:hypothetical protein